MIKVLIVDDSPTVREYMKHIIDSDKDLEVAGVAKDGAEAVELVRMNPPDVVTMDIHMPRMDGYKATRKIMELHPLPIVIVSASWNSKDVEKTFQAMEAGAVAAVEKPKGPGHPESKRMVSQVIETVKLMSEVKVVRRFAKYKRSSDTTPVMTPQKVLMPAPSKVDIVAVGASTGGPPVIRTILSSLKPDFPVPILIVQHIASGFLHGFMEWLGKTTSCRVRLPAHGERIKRGHVYFAPDGFHMGITSNCRIVLDKSYPENGLKPSVSYLFRSISENFGSRAVGVLLTGMGKDGSCELKMMKKRGSVTIAQDKESSVVHGMPGEAIKIGAVNHILSPKDIAAYLNMLVNKN